MELQDRVIHELSKMIHDIRAVPTAKIHSRETIACLLGGAASLVEKRGLKENTVEADLLKELDKLNELVQQSISTDFKDSLVDTLGRQAIKLYENNTIRQIRS